jgi:two-component system, probable response regulator PhcQ
METTILIVDDESSVLQSLVRALRNEPYTVLTALGAEEALGILRSRICKVVISDQKMIRTQGIDFLKEVRKLFPETVRVMLTGQGSAELFHEAILDVDIFDLLLKPWDNELLRNSVREAVQKFDDESKLRRERFLQTGMASKGLVES